MDVVDVVVSKLKPFRGQDVDDIGAMIKRHLVDPTKLLERFLLAKDAWLSDSRAQELWKYIDNLHEIQREFLQIEETPIDLPSWLNNI